MLSARALVILSVAALACLIIPGSSNLMTASRGGSLLFDCITYSMIFLQTASYRIIGDPLGAPFVSQSHRRGGPFSVGRCKIQSREETETPSRCKFLEHEIEIQEYLGLRVS